MLYWLLFLKLQHYVAPFRIFRYVTFRTAFASLTALFTALLWGRSSSAACVISRSGNTSAKKARRLTRKKPARRPWAAC